MLEAFGRTDVGRRRKLNEDALLVAPEPNLYAVCDGMGGHNAGEVASQMAIETLTAFIEKSHREKEITWLVLARCPSISTAHSISIGAAEPVDPTNAEIAAAVWTYADRELTA